MDCCPHRRFIPALHDLLISEVHLLKVALYSFLTPLGSSMMSPGLPEVAIKYKITSETIVALTLSIFLLSFALSVSTVCLIPNITVD
jgi:MFS family permease